MRKKEKVRMRKKEKLTKLGKNEQRRMKKMRKKKRKMRKKKRRMRKKERKKSLSVSCSLSMKEKAGSALPGEGKHLHLGPQFNSNTIF